MKPFLNIALLFFIGFISSCSPNFRVGSDSAPGVNLTKYQTFRKDTRNLFTKRSNPILNSEMTKKRIDYSITKELTGKGYELTDQNPDLIFSFQTEVKQKQSVQQNNNNNAYPYGWGYYNMRYPMYGSPTQTYVRNYEETTLIIDIRDAKTNEMVWQGWIIGELKYTENDWAQKIEETVKEALEKFPSKKK